MPFRSEFVPGAPIVINSNDPGTQTSEGVPEAMQQLAALIEAQPGRVYLILDRTGVSMSVEDLTRVASSAARGPGAILHHPQVIETLFVLSNSLMKLGAMGLSSEAFGGARVRIFDTRDQALEYCYQKIAEEAQG